MQCQVTSYLRPGQLKDRLDSANEETASLRKLLGVTEEKLRSQVLLVETISKELEVSTEEKNGHKKGLKDLQVCVLHVYVHVLIFLNSHLYVMQWYRNSI